MQLSTFRPVESRSDNRYVFCQKARLDIGEYLLPIRTVDISAEGFGILSPEPIRSDKACIMHFSTYLGNRIVHLQLACTSTYCILNGLAGYRIGLSLTAPSADETASLHALIKRRATLSKTA